MGKLNFISGLAAEAADRVTQDEKSWKEFLQTASRLYRYDFDDQLLIYAQRPDATACAPLEMWNEKMRRWIKPGSKGIALIHKRRDGSNRLDYVFDVSDTRPVHGAREPYLWELREEYRAPVLEALEKRFGETKGQDTAERLKEIVTGAFSDYLQDLEYDSWGSPLEEVDVAEWEDIFRETMEASVQYAVLTRCGFCPEDYVKDMFLSGITLFSTPAVLHHLGDACSRLTMEICTEIRREIRRLEQEVVRDKVKEHKNTENLLEKTPKEVYSESIEKFSTVKRESEEKGGNEDGRTGADIQESRGLPDTGSGDGRSGRGQNGDNAHREVRTAQGELPEGTPSRDLHIHAADGETGWAPAGSGERGQRADRPDPGTAYESGRGGREAEGIGSDAVDPAGRRHDSPGGGNGAAGSGLQVGQTPEPPEKQNMDKDETAGAYPAVFSSTERGGQLSLFPSAEEQVEKIAQIQAEEKREALTPGQHVKKLPEELDRFLDSALAGGGNESDSILRIVAFYQKGPDYKQAAAFLQEEFGVGGKGILVDGVKVSVWFGKDGLFFARGNSALVPGAVLVPWERAAARVRKLLEKGTFAAQDKLDGARDYEYQRLAESMWNLAQSLSDEAGEKGYLPYLRELYGGFPDSTEKIAALLREPGYRHVFCAELDTFIQALQKKPELLRYRRYHPERVRKEIESLNISPRQFYCTEGFEPVKGYFITEDEIDQMLRRGSGVSEGKLRIYSYIMQGHDAKECAAFLRTEYGVGGWGHAGYDEWHDFKGIQFKRADDDSGYQGYDTVFLHWNQVQERIRGLIRDGKYLGAKELEYLPEYEKMQLARELYHFKQLAPDRSGSTQNVLWDMEKGVAEFRPVLDSPKYSAELYEDMVKTFAPLLPEEVHGYETMKKALEDMGAFVRGEYSLFQPLSASVLEAEKDRSRRRKEAEKEAKRQERQTAETPKERQPEGELEKAARALAKKQRAQVATRQEMDGQLSLDFSSMGALWADNEGTAGQTEAGPVPEKDNVRQEEAPAAEGQAEKRPDPRLTPHAEEYLVLKALHPDKLIAVQVGELYLFYGKDAETVAPALDAKLLKREIDGLGETFVTGTKSWQGAVRKALEHGHSILVIGPEPGKGVDAPYVTIKERSAAEYIPLGMQLTIDGRRMMIDSVDFGRGKVSLKDLELQGWFPVFREESVAYVRECIEQEADREAETEASVKAVVEAAEKAGETDAVDLEEAKQLIVDFCFGEYGTDDVDLDSPEHVGIAYTTVGNEEYELQVEVNLSDFSINQFLDGVCIEKREYGSLRELIDKELRELDFDRLVSVDPDVLDAIEQGKKTDDGIRKEGKKKSVPKSGQEAEKPTTPQERLVPSDTAKVFDVGLPFEVVFQKLVTEEEREKERRLRDRRDYRITDDNLGAWGAENPLSE